MNTVCLKVIKEKGFKFIFAQERLILSHKVHTLLEYCKYPNTGTCTCSIQYIKWFDIFWLPTYYWPGVLASIIGLLLHRESYHTCIQFHTVLLLLGGIKWHQQQSQNVFIDLLTMGLHVTSSLLELKWTAL